ncbi:MAG: hypothetical protein V4611_02420 [Patescibacteria group bacterium]
MADHGTVSIRTIDESFLMMRGIELQTSITSSIAYSGSVHIVNQPLSQASMVYVDKFGIAGTGADAGVNSPILASTGQLFPRLVG